MAPVSHSPLQHAGQAVQEREMGLDVERIKNEMESPEVREDTVRVWRSTVMTGGVEALKKSVAPGSAPVKAECALAVAEEVLSGPVADRPNGTLPRLADEIERRAGVRISPSRLSVVLRQRGISAGDGPATP
jgi:hypothetical protein